MADPARLTSDSVDLLGQAQRAGDPGLLSRAVTGFRDARDACPADGPGYEITTANLANALVVQFEMTGDSEALDEALTLLSRPFEDKAREAGRLTTRGWALQRQAELSGNTGTMKRAVAARRSALNKTRKSDPAYPDRLSDLGGALTLQHAMTGNATDLARAVGYHDAAVARSADGDPKAASRLCGLGNTLLQQALRTGDPAILRRAVDAHREALETAADHDPYQPMFLSNLGIALLREYEEDGSPAVLDEAIRRNREALELTPEGHAEHAPRLANLASSLLADYERTSDPDTLDEAAENYQRAAVSAAGQPERRARFLYGLAGARFRQAERTGGVAGFDEVLQTLKEVRDLTPDGHPNKPNRLAALGSAAFARFREDPADLTRLENGITVLREGLSLVPPGHTERGRILSNLAALLDSRFEYTDDPETLREATSVHREALEATPAGHSERGKRQSNLAVSLVHQSRAAGDDSGLEEAFRLCQEALDSETPGDSGRAQTRLALGAAHARRYELTSDPRALSSGIAAFREAADDVTAPARIRVAAGRDGGRLAASARRNTDALSAFASAVRLLDETAWAGLGREDQERLLSRLNGLPEDAAAIAITEGRLEYAVELLEQGRGVLLVRQLEVPARHAALREHAPDLAERLAWLQRALDLPASADLGEDRPTADPAEASAARRRTKLARQRDLLIEQIRARPDLRDAVTPPPFSRLADAAAQGPVIVINISSYRCDALIVTTDAVELVPLPQLSADAVSAQTSDLIEATDSAAQGTAAVLEWIWDQIVFPVFSHLHLTDLATSGQPRRIWWCPTGIAAFLPLHAAGRYTADGLIRGTAMNMAVSSYTATLRSLIKIRERATGPLPPAGPLIVAMPQTPDAAELPGAAEEARDLAAMFSQSTTLTGPEATHTAVTTAMGAHPWAHFACHGVQELLAPSSGRLVLHDQPLTIPQLMALRLNNPEFAYLSACETYRGGTLIPDEAITLASALQLAGYRHVIATLWQIGITAQDIARHVYDQLLRQAAKGTHLDSDNAAVALRTAILALVEESGGIPPFYWAAYVHTGP